jgi:methylglutaconyl-CoA hydratase
MDLDYLQKYSQLGHEENLEDAHNLMKMLQLIYNLRKPVIAMVNGPALGGGCGIAAACDFVFAGKEKAKLGVPEARLGFIPAIILVYLIKRMGEGAAREFTLRGDILDAATAKTRGLVTEVIEDDQLKPKVYEFAKTLARTTSPASITLTKDLFNRFNEMNVKDAMEYAANLNALVRKTEDFKKGIDSFLKKEKLEW